MKQSFKLPNPSGELLDCLIEGNDQAVKIIIFAHGFGTDKHEHGLFDDLAQFLHSKYLTLRFDFSGYGLSQGKQEEVNYVKQTHDLQTVIGWVDTNYPSLTKNILAMSMGCYVTTMLKPPHIHKCLLLSVPHENTQKLKHFFQNRILTKGGTINEKGISYYPRTHGGNQKLGPSFWQVMLQLDPLKEIIAYSQLTNLLLIHPLQDEIVDSAFVQQYQSIPSTQYLELPGNHSWTNPTQRHALIKHIKNFYS